MAELDWDEQALALFFVEIEHRLLPPLAQEVADMATSLAPVRQARTYVQRRPGRKPGIGGNLKASVQWSIDEDLQGVYADIAALWYGRFLDPPAKQIKRHIPFLPSALEMVIDGRSYHL